MFFTIVGETKSSAVINHLQNEILLSLSQKVESISVGFENDFENSCKNGESVVTYSEWVRGIEAILAKGGSQLLLKPGAANLTQQGLDHIVARHWFSSGAKGAGKFLEGTTGSGLKGMINTTTTQGVFRANTMVRAGTIAEYNFGRVIGTTSGGTPASSLRVVIGTNGNVLTAFPF